MGQVAFEQIRIAIPWLILPALVGLCIFLRCLYQVLRNPVSRVPGDWHTKWTSVVSEIQRVKATRVHNIHRLHEKYGPIVRIGPHEVDVSSLHAVRMIYSTRETFIKHQPFYTNLVDRKKESVFSTSDVDLHRRQRRLLGASLTESALKLIEPSVREKADKVISRMKDEESRRGCVDVMKWWMFFTTDVTGELSFGESFRMLDIGQKTQYSHDLEYNAVANGFRIAFPRLFKALNLLPLIQIPYVSDTAALSARMRLYAEESLERHKRQILTDPTSVKPTLLSKLLADEGKNNKNDIIISREDLVTNAQTYIIAGTDTTALSMTYLVWEVCRNPEIRQTLVTELKTVSPDGSTGIDDEHLRDLPYLNQIVDETLRLHPAVSAGLPRVVPPGGVEFEGFYLPGGTVITSQAYTLSRNPTVFPSPETFQPSRWDNATKEMRDSIMAFGSGSRVCLGMHLARMELRLGTALFFLNFPTATVSTRDGMCDRDMDKRIFFLMQPVGKRCLIDAS